MAAANRSGTTETSQEAIDLVCELSEALALEFGLVDDEDLDSTSEGIGLLRRAKGLIERKARGCPEAVRVVLERYDRQAKLPAPRC